MFAYALIVLALVVVLGWIIESPQLVQIRPSWAPMQLNTALGFLLFGAALVGLGRRNERLTLVLAGALLLLASVSGAQYLLGVDLGIDRLLQEPFLTTATSHPGRMAPNTAVAFVLAALAIFFAPRFEGPAAVLATMVLLLGLVALLGYALGIEPAFGWAQLTRMAAHTAFGFVVGGAILVAFVWLRAELTETWVPVSVGASALASAVVLALAIQADGEGRALRATENFARAEARQMGTYLELIAQAVDRIAERWGRDPTSADPQHWQVEQRTYLSDFPSMIALGRLGAEGRAETIDAAFLVERSGLPGLPSRDAFQLLDGERPRLVYVHHHDSGPFVAVFDARRLAARLLSQRSDEWYLAVRSGGVLLFESDGPVSTQTPAARQRFVMRSLEVVIDAQISDLANERHFGSAPSLALASGLVLALILGFTVRLGLVERQKSAALARANAELFELQARLEQRVVERTADLRQQIALRERREAELRASNDELLRYAYFASHDLQEPMRTVASFVGLLSESLAGRADDDERQYLAYIQRASTRMVALVRDLLDYSSVGSVALEVAEVDLGAIVQETLRSLTAEVEASKATVTTGPLHRVAADRRLLKKCLLNAIDNALKFAKAERPEVRIFSEEIESGWEIHVVDNGIGIDPKYVERIFGLFSRLHTRDEYPGTGIGLAIVQRVAIRHGGSVRVVSEPGEGTELIVTIAR